MLMNILQKKKEFHRDLPFVTRDQFTFWYDGDADFKKYFRGDFKKVEDFSKYYTNPELFLQNIHWDPFFQSAEMSLQEILTKSIKAQWDDTSLVIINAHPLEMVVMGQILQ